MAILKVRDLTTGTCEDTFRVKVIRRFQAVYPYGLVREFILADHTGNHVQCTLLPSENLDISLMQEGDSVELSKFVVKLSSSFFWNTCSLRDILLSEFTTIRRVDPVTESRCIKYSEFSWLKSWLHVCITSTVHVVGRIKYIDDVMYEEGVTTMGFRERVPVLTFVLMNRDRSFLECKAFGHYVDYFTAVKPTLHLNGGTYCELRFWRIHRENGNATVYSSFDGVSDVVINPVIPEVEVMRAIL